MFATTSAMHTTSSRKQDRPTAGKLITAIFLTTLLTLAALTVVGCGGVTPSSPTLVDPTADHNGGWRSTATYATIPTVVLPHQTDNAVCVVPQPTLIRPGSTDTYIYAQWTWAEGATGYEYRADRRDNRGKWKPHSPTDIARGPFAEVVGGPGYYKLYVRAVGPNCQSNWADVTIHIDGPLHVDEEPTPEPEPPVVPPHHPPVVPPVVVCTPVHHHPELCQEDHR